MLDWILGIFEVLLSYLVEGGRNGYPPLGYVSWGGWNLAKWFFLYPNTHWTHIQIGVENIRRMPSGKIGKHCHNNLLFHSIHVTNYVEFGTLF